MSNEIAKTLNPNPGDWVVYNSTIWKAGHSRLDGRLILHSLRPPFEITMPADGFEVPGIATQRAISALIAEKDGFERRVDELSLELRRRHHGER